MAQSQDKHPWIEQLQAVPPFSVVRLIDEDGRLAYKAMSRQNDPYCYLCLKMGDITGTTQRYNPHTRVEVVRFSYELAEEFILSQS